MQPATGVSGYEPAPVVDQPVECVDLHVLIDSDVGCIEGILVNNLLDVGCAGCWARGNWLLAT